MTYYVWAVFKGQKVE